LRRGTTNQGESIVTLAQAAVGHRSFTAQALLVLSGSAALGLLSQVEVPMVPVPMSLQTLGVTLIGLTFGARLAALTVLAYLAQGAAGLPVFSGGDAGAHHLIGPTAGFLWGFVAMAWATGWLAERGMDRGVLRLFAASAIPAALLYVPGVAWLTLFVGLDLPTAVAAGAVPFLLGDAIKCAIAAITVSGGWKALAAKRG
jgi:biotin transport system substrate-specific component